MKDARADTVPVAIATGGTLARFADYVSLTKPRLNVLVVATSAVGYYLGSSGRADISTMVEAVVGTALVAAGAAVLNQVSERDTDRLMRRTRQRPLPTGELEASHALTFGIVLNVLAFALLWSAANLLAAALTLTATLFYVFVYTIWLKPDRKSVV